MKIIINIRSGNVTIESDTALMVKQDARDRQDANIENIMGAIIASIGEEGSEFDRDVSSDGSDGLAPDGPLVSNDVPGGTTGSQTVRTVGADDVVRALKAMVEQKPQWDSRSAAAVAKFMGDDVDAGSVVNALNAAAYDGDLSARTRRSGETVYSVN